LRTRLELSSPVELTPRVRRHAYEDSARAFREQLERGEARCEITQCSDDEAGRINAADNKYGEMPNPKTGERYDGDLLAGFDDDFGGTGWTAGEFAALIAPEANDPLPDSGDAGTATTWGSGGA
jgi:hypothetical protein